MAAYNFITTTTVGSGGAASIAFTGIPQTYTDLIVVLSTRCVSTGQQIICAVNSNTATAQRSLFGDGTGFVASGSGNTWLGFGDSSAESPSAFGNMQIYFTDYAGSASKSASAESGMESNAVGAYTAMTSSLFGSSAITSISFTTNNGNFAEFSMASLYGIKNS